MLKPNDCRNCGSSDIVTTKDSDNFSMGCKVCLQSSMAKESEEAAIIDWNESNK